MQIEKLINTNKKLQDQIDDLKREVKPSAPKLQNQKFTQADIEHMEALVHEQFDKIP